jgi:hypothetical protein
MALDRASPIDHTGGEIDPVEMSSTSRDRGPTVDGRLFIARGDISLLAAHAVAYSTSTHLAGYGAMYPSFRDHVPGFAAWFDELAGRRGGECSIGETFWLPLDPSVRPHGIVVVVSAGGPRTEEDKASIAVRAAVDATVPRLREQLGPEARLLIALPAFRMGMGGDRDHRLRSALAQVRSALESLERNPCVDLAVIAYDASIYQIFLDARRQVLGEARSGLNCPSALEEAILQGECVLFAGAGLSRGAGLPDWGQLMDRLARELEIAACDGLDHLDLAQWFRQRFTPARLEEIIRATFADPDVAPRPTLAHYLLMSLPVRHVVTTNYDDLLERALVALKRHPVKVVHDSDVARMGWGDGVHVVKLHGDASEASGIVLCRDDYDAFFERRPAMALLLEGLLLNQTFFFVGYGLKDPNFRQVYSRIARMLSEAQRPAFATSFETSGDAGGYVVDQWREKHLHLIPLPGATADEKEGDLLGFLDHLADQVACRSPHLFLARDVEVPPRLGRIHEKMQEVGEEVLAACQGIDRSGGDDVEVRHLAELLRFLADHGWRPPPGSRTLLSEVWLRLADSAADRALRRRLLIAGLETAEGSDEVWLIRQGLDALERQSVPPA